MARKDRTHVVGDAAKSDDTATVKFLTKEEFGRRLYKLMLAKGWRQAELARRTGLTKASISAYIRGQAFPTPTSVAKLAAALGVPQEEIFPNAQHNAIMEDQPDFEMRVSPGDPTKAWLKVDRQVDFSVAVKIAALLQEKSATDRT